MDDTSMDFLEETSELLKNNKTYIRAKSDLYTIFSQNRTSLEKEWMYKKDNIYKAYLQEKRKLDDLIDDLIYRRATSLILAQQKEKNALSLTVLKERYKKSVRKSVDAYEASSVILEERFERELNELRLEFRVPIELAQELANNVQEKQEAGLKAKEEEFNLRFQKKVNVLKQKVSKFNSGVQVFNDKVKKVKASIDKKQQELADRDAELQKQFEEIKKEKSFISGQLEKLVAERKERVSRVSTDQKNLDLEREELKEMREEIMYSLQEREFEIEAEYAKASQLAEMAKKIVEDSKKEVKTSAFWDNQREFWEAFKNRKTSGFTANYKQEDKMMSDALAYFGLPRKFGYEDLRKKYRESFKKLHPDSNVGATLYVKRTLKTELDLMVGYYELLKENLA